MTQYVDGFFTDMPFDMDRMAYAGFKPPVVFTKN